MDRETALFIGTCILMVDKDLTSKEAFTLALKVECEVLDNSKKEREELVKSFEVKHEVV